MREGTMEEVGVAAEEEEVQEEGEGHARRTRGQNQRRRWYWYDVRERSIFVIFAPPDGQRGGEGRWGW